MHGEEQELKQRPRPHLHVIPAGGGGAFYSLKYRRAGSIVWGLGFWLGKDILAFFKNFDLDKS